MRQPVGRGFEGVVQVNAYEDRGLRRGSLEDFTKPREETARATVAHNFMQSGVKTRRHVQRHITSWRLVCATELRLRNAGKVLVASKYLRPEAASPTDDGCGSALPPRV